MWFRQDLRLADNPALHAAITEHVPVIAVYIWSPEEEGEWAPGSASRWWLHQSLKALDQQLRKRHSRLILTRGRAADVLREMVSETGATAIYWNKRYEPAAIRASRAVTRAMRALQLLTAEFNGSLLADPATVLNQSGKPYQVYTAFQRSLLHTLDPEPPLAAPRELPAPARWPRSLSLGSYGLLPRIHWYETIAPNWQPGEEGARASLRRFVTQSLPAYRAARDIPAIEGTSRLSPHLHFGEISPRQIWHALGSRGRASVFLREILWREFAYHLLHHFPHTASHPLRPQFACFPWRRGRAQLRRWQQGATGVPLVDAGMRQLWSSGWMHNRIRMITGSFLVKNLRIDWLEGARWYWDTLVDADLANNTLNWQWVAGCGAHAAPYFRVFNPFTQAKRFDPDHVYVKRWIPELREGSSVSYPGPIVDFAKSRAAALQAYESLRRAGHKRSGLS